MPFVSHKKRRGQPWELPGEDDVVEVKTPDCIGRKCMAVRKCKEKCRLIEARACERIGSPSEQSTEEYSHDT